MEAVLSPTEEKDKKRGMTTSIVLHALLLIIALMPFLTFPDPPPGQEGIVVNLGLPDEGQGDNNAAPAEAAPPEEVVEEPVEETVEEVIEEPEPEPVEEVKEAPPKKEKEVVQQEDPRELALKRKKEKEAKEKADRDAKERAEKEAKRKAEAKKKAAEEAKRKKEAAAKAKADAERKAREAEAAKTKNQIGGLFGNGGGKGNTGKPGNQGDPNGDPNAKNLEGISTGSGRVGGGLGSRGVVSSPKVTDNSQKQGRVVLKVCVDSNGKVLSAEYTQRGSTTTDSRLRSLAIRNAKNWKFNKGSIDKQCGTITYDFKVR